MEETEGATAVTGATAAAVTASVSDDQLKARVINEYPELTQNVDDFTKVRALTSYSAAHTPYAMSVTGFTYSLGSMNVDAVGAGKTLGDAFDYFDREGGGVVCGHAAEMLARLFRVFGFEAHRLSVGFYPPTERGSSFTHEEVIVRIRRPMPGGAIHDVLAVCDPSPGFCFMHKNYYPMDFYEMLLYLRERNADAVDYAIGTNGEYPATRTISYAQDGPFEYPTSSWTVDTGYTKREIGFDPFRRTIYTSPRTLKKFQEGPWTAQLAQEKLPHDARYFLPPDARYFHLFPFRCGDPTICATAEKVIKTGSR